MRIRSWFKRAEAIIPDLNSDVNQPRIGYWKIVQRLGNDYHILVDQDDSCSWRGTVHRHVTALVLRRS